MWRMGGGFGGKELQFVLFCVVVALVVWKIKCLVKLCLDCDDDMMIIGKCYCFVYDYVVGFDNQGRINVVKIDMIIRVGFFVDFFGLVVICVFCYFDNVYFFSDVIINVFNGKINI